MNAYSKKLLPAVVAIAALLTIQVFAASVTAAGPSLGFPPGKPYYGSSNQRASRSATRSRSMYRNSAPVIVRRDSTSSSVAQAPTERRSYSYEPSQRSTVNSGCNGAVIYERTPAAAQRSTETRRSYSYEPSMNESSAAPRSYSAPRTRSSGSWSWQSGSKAERNNYRNR